MKAPRLQRVLQTLSLGAFLALLWLASFRLAEKVLPDVFLWLDPLGSAATLLAARAWIPALGAGLAVIASALVVGRFFCGHICPMGSTLDLARGLLKFRRRETPPQGWRQVKHWLLAVVLGSALLGVSLAFWLAPMPLVTRLWGLVVYPMVRLGLDAGLSGIRPLADLLDWRVLSFASVKVPLYASTLFVVGFFLLLFGLLRLAPRFWCRYLCPAGALLALFSGRPAWRRTVSDQCTSCGTCRRLCPMNAIPEDARETRFRECIACLRCVRVCPEQAVSFRLLPRGREYESFLPARRQFLAAGITGVGTAALALTGLDSPRLKEGVTGTVVDPDRVRPPGALPEPEFLARCLRCGECLAVCPTNTLQPAVTAAGFWGLFSPIAVARRGPCDPNCRECGRVCPTGAIRPLDLQEKMWAKMGTAQVLRQKCLAWEWGQPCLVCNEVCPYGAIEMRRVATSPVTVPFVLGHRCVGCGACENRCPVQAAAAIQVEPMNALRLAQGSYEDTGRRMGLDIRRAVRKPGEAGRPAAAGPFDAAPGASPFDPAPGGQSSGGQPPAGPATQPSPFDPVPASRKK